MTRHTFYVSADVAVDAADVLDQYTEEELKELTKELIEDGYAPEKWVEEHTPLPLEDEVIRLDAITWLRANGYTVEPK